MLTNLFYAINFSLLIVASIINLTFCILIIITVIINRQCHTIANLLLCNTNAAIILHSIVILISSGYGLRDDWSSHQPLCALRAYAYAMLCATICYSLSIEAISRLFFSVFYKQKYLQTWRAHWIMIITSWILSALTEIIPFFFDAGFYSLEQESHFCVGTTQRAFASLYAVGAAFFIPLTIVLVTYGVILNHAYQSTRRVTAFVAKPSITTLNMKATVPNFKREMRIMKNVVILLGLFMCGGIPYIFLLLWHLTQPQSPPEWLYLLSISSMAIAIAILVIIKFRLHKDVKDSSLKCVRPLR